MTDCPLRLSEVHDRIAFPTSDEDEAGQPQPHGRKRGGGRSNGKRPSAKGRKTAPSRPKK